MYNSKYFKGQHKESKESRRARNKAAKRAKYDPQTAETTRQVKERLAREAEEEEDEDDDDNEEEQIDDDHEEERVDVTMEGTTKGDTTSSSPPPTTGSSRIEALRAKLRAKLEEKRSQRPSSSDVLSKRASRRAEKQRRQEEAKKRKASKTGLKQTKASRFTVSGSSDATPQSDLANLDFGKLAGLQSTRHDNNKSLANLNKKKNLQKLLADAEKKKEKLEALKRGTEEDKARAARMQWSDALQEAGGNRVKDDPAKLRKALKRKEAQKKKSAKAWKSRLEQTKQKMDDRQRIRSHNLDKRKLGGSAGANLSRKRIASEEGAETEKRGRPRVGFEGKKDAYINDKQ